MNGNLTQVTDQASQVFMVMAYDRNDRVFEQQYGGSAQLFRFEYLDNNVMDHFDRRGNRIRLTHDADGRCTKREVFLAGSTPTDVYRYNGQGEMFDHTLPLGNKVLKTFDSGNADPLKRGNVLKIARRTSVGPPTDPDLKENFSYLTVCQRLLEGRHPRLGHESVVLIDYLDEERGWERCAISRISC